MFLSTSIVSPPILTAVVQLPAVDLSNESSVAPVYSGIRFDSDGKIYKMSTGGIWQYAGVVWLLSGAASDYWLHRTIVSGTFTNDDGDALQLNTDDLDYWMQNSVNWFTKQGSITFEIADDAIKTTVYATRTYNFSAYHIGEGDPP